MNNIAAWFRRQAENPQIVILVLVMLAIAAVIYVAGNMLTPLIAALVIAYLLQGGVDRLQGFGVPHLPSVIAMFLVFMAGLIVAVVWLLPLLILEPPCMARNLLRCFQRRSWTASSGPASSGPIQASYGWLHRWTMRRATVRSCLHAVSVAREH